MYKFIFKLIVFLKSNVFLYRLNILFRQNQVYSRLPTGQNDLFLTGYQRSGNTFFSRLISKLFPKYSIASHFHTVASIKMAMKQSVPTIVIIRHPSDSVTSSIVRSIGLGYKYEYALKALYEYKAYFDFLNSNLDLDIVSFSSIIREPHALVLVIEKKLGIVTNSSKERMNEVELEVKAELKTDKRNALSNTWYSKEKEEEKEKVKHKIESSALFIECCTLYESLKKRAVI